MTVLNCARDLQALMPSRHVWSSFALPALPHFLNHEPPTPQQLIFPDRPMVPHLGHVELAVVVVRAGVCVRELVKQTKEDNFITVSTRMYLRAAH